MIKFKTKNPALLNAMEETPPQELMKYTDFAQNYLKYHIHKNTAEPRNARPHDQVHASDLDPARNWCPREPALLTKYNIKRETDFLATATRITYDFGYAGADILMRRMPEKMLWGNWHCRACDHFTKHTYKPQSCVSCGAHKRVIRYCEVLLRDDELGIIGSVDIMADLLGNGKVTPIEAKTEGNLTFKPRSKSTFDHEWRTKMYLYLASKTKDLPPHKVNSVDGRVIYLCKEGHAADPLISKWKLSDWKKSPMKEYFVKRDDTMLENALAKAKSYRMWRNGFDKIGPQAPMPARICKNALETKAKNCAACKVCFK